jgi:hypothetical protein
MQQELTSSELVEALLSADPNTRTSAWLRAGEVGAAAVNPLVKLMVDGEMETSRAARRAIWKIVRTMGSPEVPEQEKRAVIERLSALLKSGQPVTVRREVLWMLSEIADSQACEPIGVLLMEEELREDARCALERIPGDESIAILEASMKKVPDDFKMNIVQSLRARGVKIEGYPCRKLVPAEK